ncbi:PTS sugar transporter subunit IIB [Clostridium fallax]|uniref:PTS system, ascorbate-specific IIB component n=1 Tax=Clostridium fallax TaxID=1533 RepID=A0A1M4SIR6_9CLOT|nr:PTS sugar transporter subunit IIB [Clostridium fallax]SHE32101.1 PTS system, ascorbate-specific IIB component [Clostridium fallax]SQB07847.1 PTS system transporter subunit IIB [Clostridium fallax]
MKILACCGNGLAGSFIIQRNVETALKELGIKDVDVEVSDLASAKKTDADIYVGGRDVAAELMMDPKKVISLNNIIDMIEIRTKLLETLNELGYHK